jgi:hypothetical protein
MKNIEINYVQASYRYYYGFMNLLVAVIQQGFHSYHFDSWDLSQGFNGLAGLFPLWLRGSTTL